MNKQSSFIRMARRVYGRLNSLRASEGPAPNPHQEMEQRISHDRDYFATIKGKFAGRRGFVIGNGPSLKVTDLDRLRNEVCIASNKIYLAFGQTIWRPTFFTIADPLVWEKLKGTVGSEISPVLIPHYLPACPDCTADTKTFRCLGNAPDLLENTDEVLFSDDFMNGAYGGYTVTYENIQLAAHLGLNPIYIIGCDHFYEGEKDVMANQKIGAPTTSNHFVNNYREPGEIVNVAPIEKMNQSYQMANRFAQTRGISLMNATRGGFLETFPRVDFDEITAIAE